MTPKVSVSMITYNHEQFIAEAIEGVLMQETEFDIELLIHDDASTDRTADIVREYEAKHPDIIKPIYQTENQYSQNPRKPGLTNMERAAGEYLALCDGDDYWTDPKKLQKQVEFMEKHPECSLCGHPVRIVDVEGNWDNESYSPKTPNPELFDLKKWLELGYCIQTCSVLYRRKLASPMPEWYWRIPFGDIGLQAHLAQQGLLGYLPDVMADYRIHTGGVSQSVMSLSPIDKLILCWRIIRRAMPTRYRYLCDFQLAWSLDTKRRYLQHERRHLSALCLRLQSLYYDDGRVVQDIGWLHFREGRRIHAAVYGMIAFARKPTSLGGLRLVTRCFGKPTPSGAE